MKRSNSDGIVEGPDWKLSIIGDEVCLLCDGVPILLLEETKISRIPVSEFNMERLVLPASSAGKGGSWLITIS